MKGSAAIHKKIIIMISGISEDMVVNNGPTSSPISGPSIAPVMDNPVK
jgi:hypothetical protein